MSYTKQTWTDGAGAPNGQFNAARGNTIEQGIYDAGALVDAVAYNVTTYTLSATNPGNIVELTSASATNLWFPQDSAVSIPIGSVGEVHQIGAGQVTANAGTGATIQVRGGANKIAGQYGTLYWRKRAANTYILTGDLTA